MTARGGGNGADPAGRRSIGASGDLPRRAMDAPLTFSFTWHGKGFRGVLEAMDGGTWLSARSDLVAVPYSTEDRAAHDGLLALVDSLNGRARGKLKVVHGQSIVLENDIPIPHTPGGTISPVVTNLALLVLDAAPYRDLIAEY